MIDRRAQSFGLKEHFLFPIAARSVDALQTFVGPVKRVGNRDFDKVCAVVPGDPHMPPGVPGEFLDAVRRLVFNDQVWVHVAYTVYREAYIDAANEFRLADATGMDLDHVANRKFAPLYGFEWTRLCPVSSHVNTNAGGSLGGEFRVERSASGKLERAKSLSAKSIPNGDMVYADPFDITKMLNRAPGNLRDGMSGVPKIMKWLY